MSDSDFTLKTKGAQAVVIRRSFEAPAEKILAAFLDPALLTQWMGAPEMPLSVCEVDAQAGGRYRMAWTRPDGSQAWMAGRFAEIAPGRIVASEIHRPDWTQGEMQVTTDVVDHEGRGHLRRIVEFGTPEARNATMGTMAPGTIAGFDRLEALLGQEAKAAT
jgi:uncharacterized protein YndB with AHSA1/START domain